MFKIKIVPKIRFNRSIIFAIAAIVLFILLTIVGFKANQQPTAKPSPLPSPLYNAKQDFHLVIPALKIDTPVIADVDGADQNAYFKALENGVAQLKGSAKPGEGSNIFIFGHSSFYWYKPGNYKTIFAKLEDIKIGDEIILWYGNMKYVYIVSETKVVDPEEVDDLKPTKEEQVSLMTCVPPGTIWHRLIVVGKLKNN